MKLYTILAMNTVRHVMENPRFERLTIIAVMKIN